MNATPGLDRDEKGQQRSNKSGPSSGEGKIHSTFQPDAILKERCTFARWRSVKNSYRCGAGCGILSGGCYCLKRVVASKRWGIPQKNYRVFWTGIIKSVILPPVLNGWGY
jgi:hypothetical protein